MVDFATDFRNGNPANEIAALDYAVYLAPSSVDMPTVFADPDTGDLAPLPDGFISVGNLDKKAAIKLANTINTTPVETYGEQSPTRIIRKSRDVTIDFTMQETTATTLGLWWGQDFSAVTADPTTGEVNLPIAETAFNIEYGVVLIGFDGEPGAEIYTILDGPRGLLQKAGDSTANDDGILMYPATVQFLKHRVLGYAVRPSYCGLGFKTIGPGAGWVAPATSISMTPATVTIAHTDTVQMRVVDNHLRDRTNDCTYVSATTADATVGAHGLVTGVASGSSVITAHLGGLTDTTTVTLT